MKKIVIVMSALVAFNLQTAVHAEENTLEKVYRLYYKPTGEHLYTRDLNERVTLVKSGWRDEGVAFETGSEGEAVYRVYNPVAKEHVYSLSEDEIVNLEIHGWKREGIAFYTDSQKRVPVYRVYNPNKFAFNHHYTYDSQEASALIGFGWHDENIPFYVAKEGNPEDKLEISKEITPADTPSPSAKPILLQVPYYSQRDPRWGAMRYGRYPFRSTGCGIAALASAFSTLLQREVLPPEIADVLYTHGYFNNGIPGISSASVVFASQQFGVNFEQLTSPDMMRDALKEGKIVTMAVAADSPLSMYGDTHALTLFGYRESDDATSVFEPYNEARNGVYNIPWLFSIRSDKPSDLDWGQPFYIFSLWK